MSYFDGIVSHHILVEGGLVENPLDPGLVTKYGIAQRYNRDVDVRNLTVEQAKEYYRERYWKPLRLDDVKHKAVAAELFDIGAGPNGIRAAGYIVQGALVLLKQDVAVDGVIGPKTIQAINSYRYPDDLVKMMNCLQFTHLLAGSSNIPGIIQIARERLPQLREFMRGWLKRVAI